MSLTKLYISIMYNYILTDYAGWKECNFFDSLALKNQVLVIVSKGKKEAENIFERKLSLLSRAPSRE